jgi:hypothetical protein
MAIAQQAPDPGFTKINANGGAVVACLPLNHLWQTGPERESAEPRKKGAKVIKPAPKQDGFGTGLVSWCF